MTPVNCAVREESGSGLVLVSSGVAAFDKWAAKGRAREDRDTFVGLMLREGRTLQEIADGLGVTRERVRQLAKRVGEDTRRHDFVNVDLPRLIRELRKPTMMRKDDLAAAMESEPVTFRQTLKRTGLHAVVTRLFHWRRTYPTRQRIAHAIRELAERLGRTPTGREIAEAFGWGPTQTASTLSRAFGSQTKAMLYCGLTPRDRGGSGHVTHRPLMAACKRGHPLVSGNVYTHPATGSRHCKTCRRERDKQRYHRSKGSSVSLTSRAVDPLPSSPSDR